jgi:hypothetical protein
MTLLRNIITLPIMAVGVFLLIVGGLISSGGMLARLKQGLQAIDDKLGELETKV